METIQASEFKAKCLALMDEVAATGKILVVTKNGRPVAELHPYSGQRVASPFGLHKSVVIKGDIVESVSTDDWEVLGWSCQYPLNNGGGTCWTQD